MLKTVSIAFISALVGACGAAAAQNLYSNASPDPNTPALASVSSTGSGVPAPGGASWSEVGDAGPIGGANAVAGFAAHAGSSIALAHRVADDVVVPVGASWSLSSVTFYVYSPGFAGASPVASADLKIWLGQPGEQGSVLANSTTVAPSVAATNTYRVFVTSVGPAITSPDTTRRIWAVTIPLQARLDAGAYWFDLQLTASAPGLPVYVVPATLATGRAGAGWNGLQQVGGTWQAMVDPAKSALASLVAQDLAFVIGGSLGNVCDSVDFNQDGSFYDPTDIDAFLSVFSEGPCVPAGATCGDVDFNNDGSFFDPQDVDSFLSVFSEGPCL
jgi:hypothetical protein